MNKNISVLFFVAFSFLLRISLYGQINLKTEQLNNWELGNGMEKVKPQNMRYKDDTPLKEGNYILEMRGDNKASFYVNSQGQIDGQISFSGLEPSMDVKMTYRNDTLVEFKKIRSGVVLESAYLKNNIFYTTSEYGTENKYQNGEIIYSKSMNLSGWDIQDEIKGFREFYYGTSNIVQSRTRYKNLKPGIKSIEEEFDKKGKPEQTTIVYDNGKKKTIRKDGSYEILITAENGEDYFYEYTNKGKLLSKTKAIYPTISN